MRLYRHAHLLKVGTKVVTDFHGEDDSNVYTIASIKKDKTYGCGFKATAKSKNRSINHYIDACWFTPVTVMVAAILRGQKSEDISY